MVDPPQPSGRLRRLAVQGLVLTLLAWGVEGCTEQTPPPPTRPVRFAKCPAVRVVPLPTGFRAVRRSLPRLGDGHMGTLQVFRRGRQQLQLYSGPDLHDDLDDLDLTAQDQRAGPHTFRVWSGPVAPDLLVAVLVDGRLEAPCDHVGLLTRYVSRPALRQLMRDFRVGSG